MTESYISAVISTSSRGELKISGAKSLRTNRPLSPEARRGDSKKNLSLVD